MKHCNILPDGRMRTEDAAQYTGFSRGTLANWRVSGKGPRYLKRGGRVFYLKDELDKWMLQNGSFTSTSQSMIPSVANEQVQYA